jgi:hypothetical protein
MYTGRVWALSLIQGPFSVVPCFHLTNQCSRTGWRGRAVSIRRRALDLVYALVNETNITTLTKELIDYLAVSDLEFKTDLTKKICELVQRYAPSRRYHVDTLLDVFKQVPALSLSLSLSLSPPNATTHCALSPGSGGRAREGRASTGVRRASVQHTGAHRLYHTGALPGHVRREASTRAAASGRVVPGRVWRLCGHRWRAAAGGGAAGCDCGRGESSNAASVLRVLSPYQRRVMPRCLESPWLYAYSHLRDAPRALLRYFASLDFSAESTTFTRWWGC